MYNIFQAGVLKNTSCGLIAPPSLEYLSKHSASGGLRNGVQQSAAISPSVTSDYNLEKALVSMQKIFAE